MQISNDNVTWGAPEASAASRSCDLCSGDGNAFNYQYNGSHQLTVETDTNGHSFNFEYDADGQAYHSWQEGNNNAVTLSFDTVNLKTTVTDSRGKEHIFTTEATADTLRLKLQTAR